MSEGRQSIGQMVGALVALMGVVLLAVGMFLGFGSLSRDGSTCGSAFGGASQDAAVADYTDTMTGFGSTSAVADCQAALGDRSTVAQALLWPGVALTVIGAGMVLWVFVSGREDRPIDPSLGMP